MDNDAYAGYSIVFPYSALIIGLILDEVNKKLKLFGIPSSIVQFIFALSSSYMFNLFLPHEVLETIDRHFTWVYLEPHTILLLTLPPLIFDSAFRINSHMFYANLTVICSLTIFLYFGTLFISCGLMLPLLVSTHNCPISMVFLFLTIIVATDPVAVLSMLEEFGAPHRLRIMIEGESLLNDGLAITLYKIVVDIFLYEKTGKEVYLAPQIWGIFMCFLVSPIVGAIGGYVLAHILSKITETRKKQALLLLSVYVVFMFCDKIGGSSAIGLVLFGVTLNYYKEVMLPETSEMAGKIWQSLSYWANNVIFFYAGYLIGREMFPRPEALSNGFLLALQYKDIYILIQGILITPIPLLARIICMHAYYKMFPYFSKKRPSSKSAYVLLAYSGLRGALSLILAMEFTKKHSVEAPRESQLVLLLTCASTFTCLVFQGVTYPAIAAKEGTTLRSRYDKDASERFNLHVEKKISEKLAAMKCENLSNLIGANWTVAKKAVQECLHQGQNEGETVQLRRCELGDPWSMTIMDAQKRMKQIDINDAKTWLYGMLLGKAYHYWHQGAVSGNTMHVIAAIFEHGIDEGTILPEDIEEQLCNIEASKPFIVLWYFSEYLFRTIRRFKHSNYMQFCSIGDHPLFPESSHVQTLISRPLEKWWIFHAMLVSIYALILTWSLFIKPVSGFSIYLSIYWIFWLTSLLETIYIIRKCPHQKQNRYKYMDVLPTIVTSALMTVSFYSVFHMLNKDRFENSSVENVTCNTFCFLFISTLLISGALRLVRAVPISIVLLYEACCCRKLSRDRTRMAVFYFLHFLFKETRISLEFFSQSAYRTVTKEKKKLTNIIEGMMRLDFKENKNEIEALSVIKTRQTVRMISFALQELLITFKREGCLPPEAEERWNTVIFTMREYADELLVVPKLTLEEQLENVKWIRVLKDEKKSSIISSLIDHLKHQKIKYVKAQQSIKTSGKKVFYIKKGICKITEWLPSRTLRLQEFYRSEGEFIALRNCLLINKFDDGNPFPLMFPKRRYETTTDCELVEITENILRNKEIFDRDLKKEISKMIQLNRLVNELRYLHLIMEGSGVNISLDNVVISLPIKSHVFTHAKEVIIPDKRVAIIGCWTQLLSISSLSNITEESFIRGPCVIHVKPLDEYMEGIVYIEEFNCEIQTVTSEDISNISLAHDHRRRVKVTRSNISKIHPVSS